MATYSHPEDYNLNNLHKSMQYNALAKPVIRVSASFGGGVELNDSTAIDAFGRLRTSSPYTLFDCHFRYGDNSRKWNSSINGTGQLNYLSNESSMQLVVSQTGDYVIRETKNVFSYQPGKSLLNLCTFAGTAEENTVFRVGYFDASDGIFFEVENSILNMVRRSSTTGSVVDTQISQSSWNVDTLDGSGDANNPSGLLIDITKTQIFWTDVEWLGVGSVRCGFVINGVFILCHVFHHANNLTSAYMKTACLPQRYELISTGGSTSIKQICSTVISEGGYANKSVSRSLSTALAGKQISNAALTPLVAIRLKSTNLGAVVIPSVFDVYGLQSSAYKWALVHNPTLTGGVTTFTSVDSESSVEYNIVSTAMTGGTVMAEGIFVGSNKGGSANLSKDTLDLHYQLGRFLNGTSDIFCLAAIATSNNDLAVGSVNWQEHT